MGKCFYRNQDAPELQLGHLYFTKWNHLRMVIFITNCFVSWTWQCGLVDGFYVPKFGAGEERLGEVRVISVL